MFKKMIIVAVIIAGVIISYVILTATMPAVSEMAGVGANATNIDNYPGSAEAMQFGPMIIYALPGGIGLVAIFITLRSRS